MTMESNENIVILGGGLNGLFLGYFLKKKYPSHKIAIVEKSSKMGGLVEVQKVGSTEIEKFYHHVFLTDKVLLNMLDELNISDLLDFRDSSVANLENGFFQPFVTPMDLLNYKGLSLFSKIRIGLLSLFLQKSKSGDRYVNKNTEQWIRKNMGNESWNKLWGPLFLGKFHDYAKNLSLSFLWARLNSRASSKKGGKEQLGYMRGSFDLLTRKLVEELETMDVKLVNNVTINKITKFEDKYEVQLDEGVLRSKVLISTFSPVIFKEVFKDFVSESYLEKLDSVKYLAAICPMFTFEEQITPYYWTNIIDSETPFKGIIEHTNLFDHPEYEGNKILYLSHYLKQDDALLQKDDEYLKEFYLTNLEKALGRKLRPKQTIISKAMFAQPVFTLDLDRDVIKFETPISNVYQCNMTNLLPMERGINNCAYIAKKLVDSISLRDV